MQTGVELAALGRWMDRTGLGTGPITDVRMLAGGTQNIVLRFSRDRRDFVLRRPPIHPRENSSETIRREARMLQALASTDLPLPRLIACCHDEATLGAAFYLMEPVEGFNATTGLPELHLGSPELRRRMGLALVEGIAALGALDYRAQGLEGFGRPDNYLERQVARWKSQLDSYADSSGWSGARDIPGVERVANWLRAYRPASFEAGIIHGDYQLANVMYRHDGPELAAIVDWELTTIGDPLLDLGWLLATWPEEGAPESDAVPVERWDGFPTIQELIEHYRPRTERDLSHIVWYGVLACYKLGIILEGSYARACAGRAPMDVGQRLHAKTIGLFERALRWIN